MRRTPRRHAAKGSRAAALALSLATTAGLTGLFARADGAGAGTDSSLADSAGAVTPASAATTITPITAAPAETAPAAASDPQAAPVTESTVAATAAPVETTAAPVDTTAPAVSGPADGVYVGGVSSNKWGDVQVQVTISGGAITAVDTLLYPDGDRKSVRINAQALPLLEGQVLAAQGTQINGVSGATYTTRSYVASLQSALDEALAA